MDSHGSSYYRKMTFVIYHIPILSNLCRELRARDPCIVTIIPYSGIVEIADHRRHIILFPNADIPMLYTYKTIQEAVMACEQLHLLLLHMIDNTQCAGTF